AVPILAIAIDILVSGRWTLRQLLITGVLSTALASGAIYSWYFKADTTYNIATDYRLGELNRVQTIQCWFQSTSQSDRGLWLGMGFGKPAQEHCGPDEIPSLRKMEKGKGLQHAHNFYAQIFAETGLSGLLVAVGMTIAGFRAAWRQHLAKTMVVSLPLLIYITLMALGLTFWQVMMINQVLVGFSLAALSAKEHGPAAANAATPEARPT
ncbi:MAG: hypothetical protein EBZ29_09020, partial [Synechococcaceae bacterium WB9_4xC_028]|nr:hypothetical protein [Synechococcaceae bacterium WB9_4xC_028]